MSVLDRRVSSPLALFQIFAGIHAYTPGYIPQNTVHGPQLQLKRSLLTPRRAKLHLARFTYLYCSRFSHNRTQARKVWNAVQPYQGRNHQVAKGS